MNILLVSHRIPYPPNKGEKIRTYNQIKHLLELGHQVTVLTPLKTPEEESDAKSLEATHSDIKVISTNSSDSLLWRVIPALIKSKPMSVANFYESELQEKLDRFLTNNDIDALICTSSSMAEYVFQSKVLTSKLPTTNVKLLMDFMDLDSEKWMQYQKANRFPMNLIYRRESKLISKYEKQVQEVFDACFFISQAEIKLFGEIHKTTDKLYELGNGIDTETFSPNPTRFDLEENENQPYPIFLFTGVMDYLPNEDAVCWFVEEAWDSVKRKHPNAQFIIAGMNPSKRVQNLNSHKGIVITGFVDDIMEYYHKAHFFIAPFRLARGVQNKVLQAFSCGLPTITTSMGCEGINCENGKHVIIANTIGETTDAINDLIANQDRAEALGQSARELVVAEFSWESKLNPLQSILYTPSS